ncbi:xanthine dehydrogenase molybdenum-binding subunit [Lachnospiraceae bacterium PM6-15]|uniref:xanthine dehydrogenase subunit XdhA n=1 Tax=Ohessyouella blattaphilus TaxID=2949333 RepID=UPI003E2DFDA8
MGVYSNFKRVDATGKVTGEAKYTDDLLPERCLVAKVVHSTISNGLVKKIHTEKAAALPGVVKIVTCFDVPDIQFPTPGHPWSVEESHQDVSDRKLLNQRVRFYGDDIAAIVAEDEVSAAKAAALIEVEYEEYEPILSPAAAMAPGASVIHQEYPGNVLKKTGFKLGECTYAEALKEEGVVRLRKNYEVPRVQHCHIEVPVSFAYIDVNQKITIVSSTQIPHIVRRVVGQALGIGWGQIRVIKPYIGGGFGNKQDVLYEPLNAFLTQQVGGRPVKLELSREETLACTRMRHRMLFSVDAAVRSDGTLVARKAEILSDQGGYASHGHAIVANAANEFKQLYHDEKALEIDCATVYTNLGVGGAMRGYGIPQGDFGLEAMIDDLAACVDMDPYEFRLKNCVKEGYEDPHNHIKFHSYGLEKCMEEGKAFIHWDERRAEYAQQTGPIRRGVGMAIFCYKTGVHPISLETAACRMILNQDGSVQVQLGATEIGQGADTVFTQMAAEVLGITEDKIYVISTQDTDVTPFDTGAYASRQSYVSGKALVKTGKVLVKRILDYAGEVLARPAESLALVKNQIVDKDSGKVLRSLAEVATEAFYSLQHSVHITAEETSHCKDNTFASGACFVEVEVDIPLGQVKVLKIVNVHDSGKLLNPQLAQAQVHGGMSMGLGYALSEELLYDEKGKPLNDNLLDYKLPTAMDTPDLHVIFVEEEDESGPFGNKALGEPPAIPVAPAIRNAVLHATGVAIDSLPLAPQKLVRAFTEAGLISKGGEGHV